MNNINLQNYNATPTRHGGTFRSVSLGYATPKTKLGSKSRRSRKFSRTGK